MAFQVSPGVNVSEIDATTVVPSVSTSTGAISGALQWGPIDVARLVSSEDELVQVFGKPDSITALTFFTAANFLSYSNSLYVSRADAAAHATAVANVANAAISLHIRNEDHYYSSYYDAALTSGDTAYAARYVGALGNSLKVAWCGDPDDFATWTYAPYFDRAPGTSTWVAEKFPAVATTANDELHVVVVDEDGLITGTPNTVIERFSNLSKATNAKDESGATLFYRDVLFTNSRWIYAINTASSTWGVAANATHVFAGDANNGISMVAGALGTPSTGNVQTGYAQFASSDNVDISLVMAGGGNETVSANVISLAVGRRDCVAFVSPALANVQAADPVTAIVNYRNNALANVSESFAVMDSGWKYQYDKYNDVYRWVPCNGDVAGLCARTDQDRDPWFSPAGFNRGALKNVIKLAFNPSQAQRDTLYKAGVNPIVSFPGEGTVLFGDKTLLSKPSAFDRINVRRLFIVLEKAIARAARAQLFEFNDEFTRAQFVNLVEPFLRLVQGRRGIYDFRVVCDETNNTPEVIDRNEFIGDIYIKPAKAINFIQLNFVAVRTGVAFDEIVGRF
jgi:Phage tail sheath protein subtilisin-like domain/Phage tail sheath C-terminal domain